MLKRNSSHYQNLRQVLREQQKSLIYILALASSSSRLKVDLLPALIPENISMRTTHTRYAADMRQTGAVHWLQIGRQIVEHNLICFKLRAELRANINERCR